MPQPCNPGSFTRTRMAERGDLFYRSLIFQASQDTSWHPVYSDFKDVGGGRGTGWQLSDLHLPPSAQSMFCSNTSESLPASPQQQKSVFQISLSLSHHYWDAVCSSRNAFIAAQKQQLSLEYCGGNSPCVTKGELDSGQGAGITTHHICSGQIQAMETADNKTSQSD